MKNLANMTDADLSMLIVNSVRKAVAEQHAQFVTGTELCKMFQCFSPSKLKKIGSQLPRTRITEINSKTGKSEHSHYAYNVAAIRKMIDEDRLTFVTGEKVAYRPSKARKNGKQINKTSY